LRPIYFGFRRATMALSGVGHIMGCGGRMPSTQEIAVTLTPCATSVKGIRPPQPEKIDADGTTFFVTFFNGIIIDIKQL
jgi:hypothetical protein